MDHFLQTNQGSQIFAEDGTPIITSSIAGESRIFQTGDSPVYFGGTWWHNDAYVAIMHAEGPLTGPVIVKVYSYGSNSNTGMKYVYSVPIITATDNMTTDEMTTAALTSIPVTTTTITQAKHVTDAIETTTVEKTTIMTTLEATNTNATTTATLLTFNLKYVYVVGGCGGTVVLITIVVPVHILYRKKKKNSVKTISIKRKPKNITDPLFIKRRK